VLIIQISPCSGLWQCVSLPHCACGRHRDGFSVRGLTKTSPGASCPWLRRWQFPLGNILSAFLQFPFLRIALSLLLQKTHHSYAVWLASRAYQEEKESKKHKLHVMYLVSGNAIYSYPASQTSRTPQKKEHTHTKRNQENNPRGPSWPHPLDAELQCSGILVRARKAGCSSPQIFRAGTNVEAAVSTWRHRRPTQTSYSTSSPLS
jgi:hypothetical protein